MFSPFDICQSKVRVWRCDLRSINIEGAGRVLSSDEIKRANAFVFQRDRVRYRAGRLFLRAILARCLGRPLRAIKLTALEHTKPALVDSELRFNVSHCADSYVLAVSPRHDVGVDIELKRRVKDAFDLARTVFSTEEVTALYKQPEDQVSDAFLRGWTRKEAFVKALGIGLGGADLKGITVGLEVSSRVVPAITGTSTFPVAVRSLDVEDAFIAIASTADVNEVEISELNQQDLIQLCTVAV